MNQNLHVCKTNFHMKGFALGFALKQMRKATQKSAIRAHNLPDLLCMYARTYWCKHEPQQHRVE